MGLSAVPIKWNKPTATVRRTTVILIRVVIIIGGARVALHHLHHVMTIVTVFVVIIHLLSVVRLVLYTSSGHPGTDLVLTKIPLSAPPFFLDCVCHMSKKGP